MEMCSRRTHMRKSKLIGAREFVVNVILYQQSALNLLLFAVVKDVISETIHCRLI